MYSVVMFNSHQWVQHCELVEDFSSLLPEPPSASEPLEDLSARFRPFCFADKTPISGGLGELTGFSSSLLQLV